MDPGRDNAFVDFRTNGAHGAQDGLCGAARVAVELPAAIGVGATRGDSGRVSRDLTAGTLQVRILDGDHRLPVFRLRRAA